MQTLSLELPNVMSLLFVVYFFLKEDNKNVEHHFRS